MNVYALMGIIYAVGVILAGLVVLLAHVIKKQRNYKSQKGNNGNNE